jgi:virginiamycin B lyase
MRVNMKRFDVVVLRIALAIIMASGTALIGPVVALAASPTINEYPIPTAYANPSSITTGPDGALWFTEQSANKIGRMTTAGAMTEYSIPTPSTQPSGITAGSDGALWFTETLGAGGSSKIGRITTSGDITEYPVPTNSAEPQQIVSGPDGALWFTEYGGDKIGRITTSGAFTEFRIPGVSHPEAAGITVGPDGALWFTEYSHNKIGRITTSGTISEYSLPDSFSYPSAITAGSDGNLWFANLYGGQIGSISTSGNVVIYPIPASPQIQSIAAGPDGALWFTNVNGNIGRIDTAGHVSEYPAPTSEAGAYAITAGPDNSMWFTEWYGNNIGSIAVPSLTPAQAIDAGGTGSGNFVADTDFSGGSSYTSTAAVDTSQVVNPAPQEVYQSARYGSNFSYTIPNLIPGAPYTLDLDFNELYWGTSASNGGGVGSRVFNVSVNGTPDLTNFDIFKSAGGANKAIQDQFLTTADANGNVTVQFAADTDTALVNGIELYDGTLPPLPTQPTNPTASSAYIAAGGSAVGNFVGDTDYLGGTPYSSTAAVDTSGVTNPAPEAVYQNARYGNFTYSVPNLSPNTSYNVRLDFNELYWGTSLASGMGGVGSRVFNVAIDGSQVLTNFDIFAAAGGANKAVAENFTATSDANGTVTIQFSSLLDNAMVNGIEISPAQ